jgi:hypothetical protein
MPMNGARQHGDPYGVCGCALDDLAIFPVGQITSQLSKPLVHPLAQKHSAFARAKITSISAPSRPTEGRSRSSRNAGRDTMDANRRSTRRGVCGRRSRVVLTPRRWRQVLRGNSQSDGGKRARSPGRARRKPLKPLCRESRIDPVSLWFLTRVLTTFAHEAAGALDTRLSLRPLSLEGQSSCTARALSASRDRTRAPAQLFEICIIMVFVALSMTSPSKQLEAGGEDTEAPLLSDQAEAADIAKRRLAVEPTVFAAELRRALVPDGVSRRADIHPFD